jgi:hypothetical protein
VVVGNNPSVSARRGIWPLQALNSLWPTLVNLGQDRTRAEQNRGEERIISSPSPRRSRPVRGAIHGINCGLSADRLVAKAMPVYQFYIRVQSTVASRFLAMRQVM